MTTRRAFTAAGVLATLSPASLLAARPTAAGRPADGPTAGCGTWPAWDVFAGNFMADSGRVIDPSLPDGRTTSEGQSYALLFALIANDRPRFAQVLGWTADNLAGGDLASRLPAWLWGKKPDASWGILDDNAASDADLWIAYALQEAGRLWQAPQYATLGQRLAERILDEETIVLDGLGRLLLPAPKGFRTDAGARFNPSYVPLQVLHRLAEGATNAESQARWHEQERTALRLLLESAPRGFVPDWAAYTGATGFTADPATGSFNAIRAYLWAGMLAPEVPARATLLKALRPMVDVTLAAGMPPQQVDTRTGALEGVGDAGFSAALLPLIAGTAGLPAARQQVQRIASRDPLARRDNYYEQALTLFGTGWFDGRYRFAGNGMLRPGWTCSAR